MLMGFTGVISLAGVLCLWVQIGRGVLGDCFLFIDVDRFRVSSLCDNSLSRFLQQGLWCLTRNLSALWHELLHHWDWWHYELVWLIESSWVCLSQWLWSWWLSSHFSCDPQPLWWCISWCSWQQSSCDFKLWQSEKKQVFKVLLNFFSILLLLHSSTMWQRSWSSSSRSLLSKEPIDILSSLIF